MITEELLDYIRRELRTGVDREEIVETLLANGWTRTDIELALSRAGAPVLTSLPRALTLLHEAWATYKHRFKLFAGIMLLPLGFMYISNILLLNTTLKIHSILDSTGSALLFILFILLYITLLSIIHVWSHVALIFAAKNREYVLTVKQAYLTSSHKIISYWWVVLLTGIITAGGYLLFIIPGLLFSVWFSLGTILVVAENRRGMDAILKSRFYIKGYWLSALWRFLALGLFFLAFQLLYMLGVFVVLMVFILGIIVINPGVDLAGFIAPYIELTSNGSDNAITVSPIFVSLYSLFNTTLNTLPSLVTAPVSFIYLYLLYDKLRILKRKETFTPTRREKLTILGVGIGGFIVFVGGLLLLIFIALKNPRDSRPSDFNDNYPFPTQRSISPYSAP